MSKTKKQYKREVFNQTINFFWTLISFAPVFWFWYKHGINDIFFYLFIGIAFLFGFMPEKLLNKFAVSSDKNVYERYGIKFIRKFVQNGDIVNSKIKSPGTGVIKGKIQLKQYLKTIAMYERYHWICLIFFLLSCIYSFVNGYIVLGILILILNLCYNLIPIFLQQYNKIRINGLVKNL